MRPILFCYGTRPQAIKASRLLPALKRLGPVVSIDTGQHYDFELSTLLYQQLGLDEPARFLGVGSGPLPQQTAAILLGVDEIIREVGPRAVVVIGDTVSTLGSALAAAERRIPVVHVEAGLRSGDQYMAEEISRRVVDHLSALCCAPSEAAAARLDREAVPGRIVFTGDVAFDVLRGAGPAARAALGARDWPIPLDRPFALATLHRAELVDHPEPLAAVLDALATLPVPVLLPVHPRTRHSLERLGLVDRLRGAIHPLTPLGYLEAIALVERAAVVATDSGGIQREAYWLGTPCLTLRPETEWHETVTAGANRLIAPASAAPDLGPAVAGLLASPPRWQPTAYGSGDAADRIADAIQTLRE